jgi:hypothetical protein
MTEVRVGESIVDTSRDFFNEIVKPILERECPEATAQTVFGIFGYGSEAFRMDDNWSQDHHWGLRINGLMHEELYQAHRAGMLQAVSANFPPSFRGYSLREGFSGHGLDLDSLEDFLRRTIGLDHLPGTYTEWLSIPEEDIFHVINGEVWHDPAGSFSAIRQAFKRYYPEPVRLRRIAHLCRYFSGMGTYALKRAILRENDFYATIAFARAIRLGVQLAFLLDRQYYPYDKWLLAFFERLPRMAGPLAPLVHEAVQLATPWDRKLELLEQMADELDAAMVADGSVPAHSKFVGSASSGYRLLEHDYAVILKQLPDEIREVVPVVDQIYLERFHSGYVNQLDLSTWDGLLNLRPAEGQG